MNSDWMVLASLLAQGAIAGVVVVQLVRFYKVGGKLHVALDERPISRIVFSAVILIFVLVVIRLITIDIETRDCIEQSQRDRSIDQCY